ncbi:MAG: hypothetical protein H6891_05350 [Brucellaceae bacterium]|nr:hypothetical protein [Brucellaceae bacterium]
MERPGADLYRPVPSDGGNAPKITDPALYSAEESDTAYLTDRTLVALSARASQALVRPRHLYPPAPAAGRAGAL